MTQENTYVQGVSIIKVKRNYPNMPEINLTVFPSAFFPAGAFHLGFYNQGVPPPLKGYFKVQKILIIIKRP